LQPYIIIRWKLNQLSPKPDLIHGSIHSYVIVELINSNGLLAPLTCQASVKYLRTKETQQNAFTWTKNLKFWMLRMRWSALQRSRCYTMAYLTPLKDIFIQLAASN